MAGVLRNFGLGGLFGYKTMGPHVLVIFEDTVHCHSSDRPKSGKIPGNPRKAQRTTPKLLNPLKP